MIIKLNPFSGQRWKMEDTKLVNKAGMFISDDAWNLIPLNQGINFELSQTLIL